MVMSPLCMELTMGQMLQLFSWCFCGRCICDALRSVEVK